MDLQAAENDPLQAALATAFIDSPIIAPRSEASTSILQPTTSEPAPDKQKEAEMGSDDAWKEEYDQLLAGWRAESANAREKAEREREGWRVIREREEERERMSEAYVDPHGPDAIQRRGSPCSADTGDQAISETPQVDGAAPIESLLLPCSEPHSTQYRPSQQDPSTPAIPPPNSDDHGLSGSRTWEEVPSLDSSFPSLSFPNRSANASPDFHRGPSYRQPPDAPSVSLAIFDPSLSCRARALALVSSLAINMFLPFVNGVMLGFGEIFAKHLVSFFGWNIPGSTVGIRAGPRRK